MGATTQPAETGVEPGVGAGTSGAGVLSGGVWYSLNQTLPQIYTLVQSVVAARILGPNDMGRQSYIAWATLTIRMLASGGLPPALTRYVGDLIGRGLPRAARDLVRFGWRIELVAGAAGALLAGAIGVASGSLTSAWLWAGLAGGLAVLHAVPHATLLGTQRFRQVAVVGLTQGAVGTVATVIVLLAGGGIPGMFAVEAFAAALSLVWTSVLAARELAERAPDAERSPQARREFAAFAGATSLVVALELVVWKRSEFFFLERFSAATAIAQYSIAFAMASAVARLPQAFGAVVAPAIATLHGAGAHDRIQRGHARAVRLVLLATLPVTAGVVAVGPGVLDLVYGPDYHRAGQVLLVMMVSFPFVPIASLGVSVLQGVGRVRQTLLATIVAAVVDLTLAIALVPAFDEIGAAVANSAAQITAGVLLVVLATRAVGGADLELRSLWRLALASTAAGLAGWLPVALLGDAGVLAGIVAGVAVFALAVLALRAVPPADGTWLFETVGDRAGGLAGRWIRAATPGHLAG